MPAEPANDKYRFGVPNNFESGQGFSSDSPLTPFLQNPTTCVPSLSTTAHIRAYDQSTVNTGNAVEAQTSYPSTTGCEQLSFNPSLTAQPTTTGRTRRRALTSILRCRRTPEPHDALALGDPGDHRHPAAGLHDQPQRRRRQDRPAPTPRRNSASSRSRAVPRVLQGRHGLDHSSALPGALPGYVYLGEPKPRRPLSPDPRRPTASAPTSSSPAPIEPDPETGQISSPLPEPAAGPLRGLQPALLRLRARPPGDADPLRHLSGEQHLLPWDAALPSQNSTQFFTIDSGPTAAPARRRPAASTQASRRRRSSNDRRRPQPLLPRPHPRGRRPEPHRPRRHAPRRASPRR